MVSTKRGDFYLMCIQLHSQDLLEVEEGGWKISSGDISTRGVTSTEAAPHLRPMKCRLANKRATDDEKLDGSRISYRGRCSVTRHHVIQRDAWVLLVA